MAPAAHAQWLGPDCAPCGVPQVKHAANSFLNVSVVNHRLLRGKGGGQGAVALRIGVNGLELRGIAMPRLAAVAASLWLVAPTWVWAAKFPGRRPAHAARHMAAGVGPRWEQPQWCSASSFYKL